MSLFDLLKKEGLHIRECKPKSSEDPRIESLRLALEDSTPDRAGTPWAYRAKVKAEESEEELI